MNTLDEVEITHIVGGSIVTHHAISDYFWVRNSTKESSLAPRMDMVAWLEADVIHHKAFVVDRNNPNFRAYCGVNQIGNTKFLQTYADGRWTNNLLDLPQY